MVAAAESGSGGGANMAHTAHSPLRRQSSLIDLKADQSKLSPLWQKLIAEENQGACVRPAVAARWPGHARMRLRRAR